MLTQRVGDDHSHGMHWYSGKQQLISTYVLSNLMKNIAKELNSECIGAPNL